MKFRKKPVIISAVQLRWETWEEMCEHAKVGKLEDKKPERCFLDEYGNIFENYGGIGRIGLKIPTREGVMIACENDWIIRGVKGELYSCKPDIFELTYEKVEDI